MPDYRRGHEQDTIKARVAKYKIGQVVRHRVFPFRGVVFDIDPVFNNTDEWCRRSRAEIRPHKDQPFYHLFAENAETEYVAYVSEQNLLPDTFRASRSGIRRSRRCSSKDDGRRLIGRVTLIIDSNLAAYVP